MKSVCLSCEMLKLRQDYCETYTTWRYHHGKYTKNQALYRKHSHNTIKGSKGAHFSAELEKLIILPRAEGLNK